MKKLYLIDTQNWIVEFGILGNDLATFRMLWSAAVYLIASNNSLYMQRYFFHPITLNPSRIFMEVFLFYFFWKPLPSDVRKPISEKAQAKKCPRWSQCHKWHCHHRGHLFLYTCAGRSKPLLLVFILPLSYNRKCHRMKDTASVPLRLRQFSAFPVSPAFKPASLPFPHKAMSDKPVFRQCTAGGTPATVSHAHMTITVTELPSRLQESGAFPFVVAPPFIYPRGALRHFICSYSFSPLHVYASVSMPPSGRHQVSFSLQGQR